MPYSTANIDVCGVNTSFLRHVVLSWSNENSHLCSLLCMKSRYCVKPIKLLMTIHIFYITSTSFCPRPYVSEPSHLKPTGSVIRLFQCLYDFSTTSPSDVSVDTSVIMCVLYCVLLFVKGRPQLQLQLKFTIILYISFVFVLMFTYCFNNEFMCIFKLLHSCILYFYDERCKMNFPVRDNKVLLYCIVYKFQCFVWFVEIEIHDNKQTIWHFNAYAKGSIFFTDT